MLLERVLVVDDDLLMRNFLGEFFASKPYEVLLAESGKRALALLQNHSFDLVVTDMKLGDLFGIDLLRKIKERSPQTVVLMITAFGTIESAVEAMRLGAFHYLLKPFSPDALEALLERVESHLKLVQENNFLKQELQPRGRMGKIIHESPAMRALLATLPKIARSQASVFINGESGTGKEVVAQAIHDASLRAEQPYIRVNCAAIPETLLESEFFGHEKGSFTGALTKRVGRFELADRGTLLLDEVTEIPILLQPKLLRVIQEQEFERVGGTRPLRVDVRLIATSNRKMEQAIAERVFREDLYYRLNVIPIDLPPLRERREDILPLADYFLDIFSRENQKPRVELPKGLQEQFLEHRWPGNIRQLANVMERIVVTESFDVFERQSVKLSPTLVP